MSEPTGSGAAARRVIFDTDIGTDVDDALALAVLLGSPDVEVVGVTTVYGDTLLRARLARRLLELPGRVADVPVLAGRTETLSGRPVWWAGHEGSRYPDLGDVPVDAGVDAVEWLVEQVCGDPHGIDLVAVGPLTNVAAAVERDPGFAADLRTLTVMGGDYAEQGRQAEHNFRSDSVAARTVLAAGARTVVAGLDATTRARLGRPEADAIGAGGPLGEALVGEIEAFWEFSGRPWNNPHDAVAALTLLEPGLFTFTDQAVAVAVSDNDESDGLVVPAAEPGTVSVASVRDGGAVAAAVVERIRGLADR